MHYTAAAGKSRMKWLFKSMAFTVLHHACFDGKLR
jgi:hypothetical protein